MTRLFTREIFASIICPVVHLWHYCTAQSTVQDCEENTVNQYSNGWYSGISRYCGVHVTLTSASHVCVPLEGSSWGTVAHVGLLVHVSGTWKQRLESVENWTYIFTIVLAVITVTIEWPTLGSPSFSFLFSPDGSSGESCENLGNLFPTDPSCFHVERKICTVQYPDVLDHRWISLLFFISILY